MGYLRQVDIMLWNNPQELYKRLKAFLFGKITYTFRFMWPSAEQRRWRARGLFENAWQWKLLYQAYWKYLEIICLQLAGRRIGLLHSVLSILDEPFKRFERLSLLNDIYEIKEDFGLFNNDQPPPILHDDVCHPTFNGVGMLDLDDSKGSGQNIWYHYGKATSF